MLATGGSVAFFALLAAFPGITTIVSIYGLMADPNIVGDHLRLFIGILPRDTLALLSDQMKRIAGQSADTLGVAFLVSLAVALWSANSGVAALFDALNVVYKEREKRSLLRFYGTTFLFTLGAAGFVVAAIAGVVALPIVLNVVGLGGFTESLVTFSRWPVLLAAIAVWLALVYRYGPSRREPKWRWVTSGSIFASLLWISASMLFSWYVANFDSYNKTYGSVGAVVGFMTWIWLSAVIVLIGAELNAEIEHQTAQDSTEGPPSDKPLGTRGARMADTVGEAQS